MKKVLFWLIGLVLIFVLGVAAAGFYKFNILQDDIYVETETGNIVKYNDILQLTSSIIPISSVLKTIGGDFVEVNNLIPAGVSPHGFDMSAQQRAEIEDSELVFLTGLDHIDGFLEKSVPDDIQIHLADGIELLESEGHDHDNHDKHSDKDIHEDDHHDDHEEQHHDEEHDNHEDHGHDKDPHVWLGKENIIMIAKKIESELAQRIPAQAEYFAENRADFESKLETIYSEFQENISGKNPQEFIVFHDAYNYLFESIGLDQDLKIAFSENVLHDTGTGHMAELIDEIENHGLKYIFREPQFSDDNLQKFVDEYNLTVDTLDPLGTDASSEGYINNIKNNLNSIAKIYE